MNLTIPRQPLREALAYIIQAVPTRAAKPILENVYLSASDGVLELLGTDLTVSMRCRVACETHEPGIVAVNGHVLHDFVRDLRSESVEISCGGATCTIAGDDDRCDLATVDPEEFPTMQNFGDAGVVVPAATFSRLVSQTTFAAAHDAGRYAMDGVLVEFTDGVLRMVATDGRRLAVSSAEVVAKAARPAIVPPRALQIAVKMSQGGVDAQGDVEMDLSDATWISIRSGSREMFARLIDGEFPRYAAVLPHKGDHSLDLDSAEFARKLALVSSVSSEDARAVRIRPNGSAVDLFCAASGRGEAHARMDAVCTGKPAEIAFNPDYVLEGVKRAEGERFTLDAQDKTSPARFDLGPKFVYIVMPITIDA